MKKNLLKRCFSCNKSKPATKKYFYARGDGLDSRCKECNRANLKKWSEKNREKLQAYKRKYYEENKDKWNKRGDPEYLAKNREQLKKYRAKNPERYKEYSLRYRLKKLDECRARAREYYWKNRETRNEHTKKRTWILAQLSRMARDDGMWALLEKEYKNGR